MFSKNLNKITCRTKTDRNGDFGDRKAGGDHQLFCFMDEDKVVVKKFYIF